MSTTIQGLDGIQTTLRTHLLGFRQVFPRPSGAELKRLYEDEFYDVLSPEYLEKMNRDRSFWDATWSLR